jgi:hypothetical protein
MENISIMNNFSRNWLSLLPAIFAVVLISQSSGLAQTRLTNNTPIVNLSGTKGSQVYYVISVPDGQSKLEIGITGNGDCDLYVRRGSQPTTSAYDYRPYQNTSNETVTVTNPTAGDWYIMLRGYASYSGVTLVASYAGTVGTVATPVFSLPAGTYAQQQGVAITTATPTAMIRYTTDGTDPTSSSTVYSAPLILSSTTTVKARGFLSGLADSAVATATYTITGSGVTILQNGSPRTGLTGAKGSMTYYKISVPSGQSALAISISGGSGSGDCDLYVRRALQPTLSTYDYRPYLGASNETVSVSNPAAGDWYIMLNGYTAYNGVTLTASYSTTAKPDLQPYLGSLNPRTSTETFSTTSCDVNEGLVLTGTRRLLRFTTETRNIGTADLVLRSPANNPLFTYAPCHGHYHFNNFAAYRLFNSAGQQVGAGQKIGFCLEDVSRWNLSANSLAQYNCDYQGIQAGWSDIYSSNLPGQWVDITGLLPGTYTLEISLDTANHIDEANETNNTARAEVDIGSTDGNVTFRLLP